MRPTFDRRSFMGTSLGGLAAAFAAGPAALGQNPTVSDSVAFAPETLFLTWQRDPTTTMTVQWVGAEWEIADPTVWFAPDNPAPAVPAAAEQWRAVKPLVKPFPMTDLKVFRAELTGLTPGAEYRFRIGRGIGPRQAEYRFRTMPAKATDSFTFISGGDCGVNEHAVANNAIAAKQDPMFVLIDGDLGYDNGRSPLIALEFIRNYSKAMTDTKGRLIPLVVGIGNHEVNGGFGKTRADAPFFLALFDGLYPETTYATLDFGDYLSLVLLDTGHVAPIEGEQTVWLDNTLRERAGKPHLLVANHVPAYPSFRPDTGGNSRPGTGEGNRTHWVPLFEKYAVDVVLEHHDHTFKRTHPLRGGLVDPTGIVYLGDGSWGKLRVPQGPEKRPYLARVGEAYHFTVHRLEGEQRYHVALEESGRIADVYATGKKPRYPQNY